MKRYVSQGFIFWVILLAFSFAGFDVASAQKTKEKSLPIPENINSLFQNSCMPCHGSKGGRFPTTRLNLSRWQGYGASKEAEKASLICSAVRKGTMPPKTARESKPETALTKEQVDLICQWAESLKVYRREK